MAEEPVPTAPGSGWPCKVYVSKDFDLFLSVSSLMELRNKMGQMQEQMQYHPQTLVLLDYLIRAAQASARRGTST